MSENGNNNLWLFLEALARRRGFILAFIPLFMILCGVVLFILPNWYHASTLVMAPEEETQPLVSFSGGEALPGLDLTPMYTTADVYVRILNGGHVASRILNRFDLMNYYNSETRRDAYKQLSYRTEIGKTAEGLIEVIVEDRDSKMAADMANAFVEELIFVTETVMRAKATAKASFLKIRLDSALIEHDTARVVLESFQLTNKTIDFEEQTRLAIDQAIELKISLSQTELELEMAVNNFGNDSLDENALKKKKEILLGQLTELESGSAKGTFLTLPLSKIPTLKSKYEVLYRRVKIAHGLVSVLSQQLEQARIQEGARADFSVLQRATMSDKHQRPDRPLLLLIAFGVSIFLSFGLAIFLEYMNRLKQASPENHERVMMFIQAYFGWLPGVRKKSK